MCGPGYSNIIFGSVSNLGWTLLVYPIHIDQGSPNLLGEGHISYCTAVRRPDILRNVIFLRYVTFYQIKTFFLNILFFHYWQNVFFAAG